MGGWAGVCVCTGMCVCMRGCVHVCVCVCACVYVFFEKESIYKCIHGWVKIYSVHCT